MPIRVVKVGGSLLDWPLLGKALHLWLVEQSPATNILLCGGGTLCDAIRRVDATHALGEEAAHWLCVDVLAVTARMLAAVVRDFHVVDAVDRSARGGVVILDPRRFLIDDEPRRPGCVLPQNWSVTSDSIAARLAEVLEADELVLLKSADLPAQGIPVAGYVDAHFPVAAAAWQQILTQRRRGTEQAMIRYVNLRQIKRPG
jgi:5-(aminomethyl)-3-furanmethanol phosphate kinase